MYMVPEPNARSPMEEDGLSYSSTKEPLRLQTEVRRLEKYEPSTSTDGGAVGDEGSDGCTLGGN